MGGDAFSDPKPSRLLPEQYVYLRDKCTSVLETFYDKVVCPPEGPGKLDHGDVDFLVSAPKPGFSPEDLNKDLGAVKHTEFRGLTSFAVPADDNSKTAYAQVDVHLCKEADLEWETWMGSYGDLPQIVAILSQRVGLQMTNTGLYVSILDDQLTGLDASSLFLTNDVVRAQKFLGLDENKYKTGFETAEEMFGWCSKGRFFQSPTVQRAQREGLRGRLVFDFFLQHWAHSHPEMWATTQPCSRKEVWDLAVSEFGLEERYRLLLERPRKLEGIMMVIGKKPKLFISRLPSMVAFEDDGSPVLRSIDEAARFPEVDQGQWLDRIRQNHLTDFQHWIEGNLANLESAYKAWTDRESLNTNLRKALRGFLQTDQEKYDFNFQKLKEEMLICKHLGSASGDKNLVAQFRSCVKMIAESLQRESLTPDLNGQENVNMVKQFLSLWTNTENSLLEMRSSIELDVFSACQRLHKHILRNLERCIAMTDQGDVIELPRDLETDSQSLDSRLRKAMDRLPEGRRNVFEPFLFDSEQYLREVEICCIVLGNDGADDIYPLEEELQKISNLQLSFKSSVVCRDSNMIALAEALSLPTSELSNVFMLEIVKLSKELWEYTEYGVVNQCQLISPATLTRCTDLIRQVLIHLSIYAKTLSRTRDQEQQASDALLLEMLGTPFARPNVTDADKAAKKGNRPGQDKFRSELISYYNCQLGDKIWCPVLGEWVPRDECKAAHLVPYSFPPRLMKIFLGPGGLGGMIEDVSEPCMVPQNGLYLCQPIEDALDSGKLLIVPQLFEGVSIDFRVYLLDEKLQEDETFEVNGEQRYWKSLDGKSLKFQNDNRPSKHFLYFQMLLIIIQKCIYQPPSWAYRLSHLIHAKEDVALSPHPHLIDGPLMKLSKMITDAAVLKEVRKIIPIAPIMLPDEFSEKDIEEVTEELNSFTAGVYAAQLASLEPDTFRSSSEGSDGEEDGPAERARRRGYAVELTPLEQYLPSDEID